MKPRRTRGIALLVVVTAIAIMTVVVLEFTNNARTHLDQGVNLRDEARASALADTSLVLTRACLDPAAWSMFASMMDRLDLEKMCNMLLGVFTRGRIDVPIGGLSLELEGVQGVGIEKGEIDQVELRSEEAYVGLAGLGCPSRTDNNCPTRVLTANKLRSLLCEPEIAHVFEKEQEDGHKYTREEVVGNLVDWIDADDNRINVTPLWTFEEGAGENEDGYYSRQDDRYKVKDGAFDSVEELRLIRGVNDDLYRFLKDKVSAFGSGKVDVNQASAEVIATALWASCPQCGAAEGATCGQEVEGGLDNARRAFLGYARMIVAMRQFLQSPFYNEGKNLLLKPFKNENAFTAESIKVLETMKAATMLNSGGLGQGVEDVVLLAQYGMTPDIHRAIATGGLVDWQKIKQGITTKTTLYRLQAQATVGNMSRRVFSVLKRDGKVVRTLYYREE
jgi:hypothetical protein